MLFTVVLCLIILVGGQVSYEGSPKLSEACRPSPSPENLLGCDNNDLRSQAGYYKAAVVEYKPIPVAGRSMTQAVLNNVKEYEKLIEEAGQQNVDIIVFPEYGLTTTSPHSRIPPQGSQTDLANEYFVELPNFGVVPCDNSSYSEVLQRLSCSAKRSRLYTVVNLGEVEKCSVTINPDCPEDGAFHYNTNVVFDRDGAFIARYRKFHLYFEPQFDYPELEYSSFSTDFGVEFGLFTCFDIIFANPAVELVARKGIRNFVFPTAWVDELPFLTAIQAQSLWAQSNNVNLLAAGYHEPARGSLGSGIYSGKYALNHIYDPESGTKLVISLVPLSPGQGEISLVLQEQSRKRGAEKIGESDHMWLREDLTNCTYKELSFNANKDTVCHDNLFCCDFEYDLVSSKESVAGALKLLAFDGRRTVAAKRDWFEWQVCAVLHCVNETIESCTEASGTPSSSAYQFSQHPKFKKLNIVARPLKIEYEQGQNGQEISAPALSLIDTQFRLIPQSYFKVRQWTDSFTNMVFAEASSVNDKILEADIKSVGLIQKVYGGRL